MTELIERRLRYTERGETKVVSQADLLGLDAPIVVLGEAGMGKTRLLEWLAGQPAHAWCTARKLINRPDPRSLFKDATTLVVDALDEVVARSEGYAVDLVLQKLGALGYPRFVLSCRVADWQSAISSAAIREQYPNAPRELHLEPFSEHDAISFMAKRLGGARATEVVEHFNRHGLRGFLGNPQTLEMLERVVSQGALPRTSSELFERTVDIVWREHRDARAIAESSRDQTLEAAGAAFAALLLTGSEAISRKATGNLEEGELALPEVDAFDSGSVSKVLGTRLFRSVGLERFSYWHRRIGEYLGAKWLAARADTRVKRRRLLAMFHSDGLVPASLRGLHAWLALDPELAPFVLAVDPLGVIEYGDADELDADQAQTMLRALRRVAEENPRFRVPGPCRAQGLVQPAQLAAVRASITDPKTPRGVKLLLLQQLQGSRIAPDLANDLRAVMLEPEHTYAERASAAYALSMGCSHVDWSAIVETLRRLADPDSTRLAVEMLHDVGFDRFGNELIVEVILALTGLTCSHVRRRRRDRVHGTFTEIGCALPVDRIGVVLDLLADYMDALVDPNHGGPDELNDLIIELCARMVTAGEVTPQRLWRWLQATGENRSHSRRAGDMLADALKTNVGLRRGVQKLQLLDSHRDDRIWHRAFLLGAASTALTPDAADLVALLGELDPADRTDLRWRELLRLCRHNSTEGADVRAVAKRFAAHRQDMIVWIDRLAEPGASAWERRRERERLKRERRNAAKRAEHRAFFAMHATEMRAGKVEYLVGPARSYLKLFPGMGDGLEAHQRVAEWLGTELAASAHEGFKAFLSARPPTPSASEIARSRAESRIWHAGIIIVAAMAERYRLGRGFADLAAERVIAGWLELRDWHDKDAGVPGLRDALVGELRRRRKWRSALVLSIEPQLAKGCIHVENLYHLMRSKADEVLAVDLALGWLRRFRTPANEPEHQLIMRLLASPRRGDLVAISRVRLSQTDLSDERRRSWLAVRVIVDFDAATAGEGEGGPVEPELLWELRAHLNARRSDGKLLRYDTSPRLLGWIVRTFRGLWPATPHPSSSSGDKNPWDATEFLCWAIARIGDDVGEEAVATMTALRGVEDGYTAYIQSVSADQRRKLVETRYRPPPLKSIADVMNAGSPTNAADLQAVMLDALEVAQARLNGDPLDWYKGFYRENGTHKDEESCRDELLKLIDGKVPGVQLRPESHFADDKRVDIECSASATVMVPIEIKGQWHKALWTAADDQLDKLYSSDWRADRRGVYLVLWFGAGVSLTAPPGDTCVPATPEALRDALTAASAACATGLVQVVVLDLTARGSR